MILVKETKSFYLETIFLIGLGLFFIVRRLLMGNINPNMPYTVDPSTPTIEINTFMLLFFFLFRIAFKYIKLYQLKKGLKSENSDNKTLKKYMKNHDLDDVQSKFKKDEVKEKKKFYRHLIRIVAVNILLIILKFKYPTISQWVDLITVFTVVIIIYRYLIVFHVDKKLFTDNWENKKIKEFTKELK